jgi:hypothetical protein
MRAREGEGREGNSEKWKDNYSKQEKEGNTEEYGKSKNKGEG